MLQSEGQEEAAEAAEAVPEAEVPEQNGDAPPRPMASSANLAELAKRKEAARRKEEAGAAREGQLTAKERRATGVCKLLGANVPCQRFCTSHSRLYKRLALIECWSGGHCDAQCCRHR